MKNSIHMFVFCAALGLVACQKQAAYFLNGEQINDVQYSSFISLWGSQAQIIGKF